MAKSSTSAASSAPFFEEKGVSPGHVTCTRARSSPDQHRYSH